MNSATGDSGGPTLIGGMIAGVTAFGGRLPATDVTEELDASWGEASFSTRVSSFHEFIEGATSQMAIVLSIPGDFDGDDLLTSRDVDRLTESMRSRPDTALFDLNQDMLVDDVDLAVWVSSLKSTWFGDSNLDGEFNNSDFAMIFWAGEYEDNIPGNSGWARGDWNGDGDFTTTDVVIAFQDGGYEQGPLAEVREVPEPVAAVQIFVALCAILAINQRHGLCLRARFGRIERSVASTETRNEVPI